MGISWWSNLGSAMPAVAAPIRARDALAAALSWGDSTTALEQTVAAWLSAPSARCFSSGRWALWALLEAAKLVRTGDEVIVPAYTCPTVGLAVVAAGLRPVACDISSEDFNLDPACAANLVGGKTLAIVAPHMFGVPCDLAALARLAGDAGVFLLEDAAQAAGARYQGKLVGSLGDGACFSFGRGKNWRVLHGGLALVRHPELAPALETVYDSVPRPSSVHSVAEFCALAGTAAGSQPQTWALLRRIKALGVGQEATSMGDPAARLGAWQAALALRQFRELEALNQARGQVAATIKEQLADRPVQWQQIRPGDDPAWVRLPVLIENVAYRAKIMETLRRYNIDASPFYSRPMYRYDWWPEEKLCECPRAETLVRQVCVLPLQCHGTPGALSAMGGGFRN